MKEIKRLHLMKQFVDKHVTAAQAAELLDISLHQVRRLIAKYRQQGAAVIAHGNRGKRLNNQIEEGVRDKILELAENQVYPP